jgi:hypothetical protein
MNTIKPFYIIVFLILFPLLLAVANLVVRPLAVMRSVAAPVNVFIAAGSLLLLPSAGGDYLFSRTKWRWKTLDAIRMTPRCVR